MPRTIVRNHQLLFGPLSDQDIRVLEQNPEFQDHGLAAEASPEGVNVYVTFPHSAEHKNRLEKWFFRNHVRLSTR